MYETLTIWHKKKGGGRNSAERETKKGRDLREESAAKNALGVWPIRRKKLSDQLEIRRKALFEGSNRS